MDWTFVIEPNGVVRADPGADRPLLKEALADCADCLSPSGTRPALSTYWIDHLLQMLDQTVDGLLTGGNWWELYLSGDLVLIGNEEDDDLDEAIPRADLVEGLLNYRAVVERCIADGHQLVIGGGPSAGRIRTIEGSPNRRCSYGWSRGSWLSSL